MSDFTKNRIANCKNPFQGDARRVLCVCSAGLLRSPTAAVVLSQPPYNYNTRSAGISHSFALIPVDAVLLEWADEIVCMSDDQAAVLAQITKKPVKCLGIRDIYNYMDSELVAEIRAKYGEPKK